MKINNKLKKISEFINENSFILDVGCDHALLDIYVALNKNVTCIASDINKNPLIIAEKNIAKLNLTNKIKVVQEDGLKGIIKDVDTVVIAGMGAILIKKILKDNFNLLKNVTKIIITPNNEEEVIRKYLTKHNYYLKEEELVKDKNIIYPVLIFEKGNKYYTKKELLYGPILIKQKDYIYKEYYTKKKKELIKISSLIPKKYFIKKIITNKKIREIKSIL